jgi:hypothetical protein
MGSYREFNRKQRVHWLSCWAYPARIQQGNACLFGLGPGAGRLNDVFTEFKADNMFQTWIRVKLKN